MQQVHVGDEAMSRALLPPWARRALVAAACLLTVLACCATASAADTSQRSAADIRARWQELEPSYNGSPYLVAPTLVAPYATGTVAPGFLEDGLNAINYVRYLAGLPDDVTLDATYNSRAQHGAVLIAVGEFAHSQPKPADMAQAFYDVANAATSSSNLGWGYSSLWAFNFSCMDDDGSNMDRVGHRRWLLNPPLQKTGMGYASSRTDTYVFDWSRSVAVAYDAVKWPCAGPFPIEMFGVEVPWSITLNPALYTWTAGTAGHTVTLRRESDGRTWTFTSADTNKNGEYFNFETSGYGVANCFVFRPDPAALGTYAAGDVFEVTLSGGIFSKADGSPATVSYTTAFISQEAASETGDVTPPTTIATGADLLWHRSPVSLSFTATDEEGGSGVALTEYRVGAGVWTAGSSVVVAAPSDHSNDGVHAVSHRSRDAAGNVEAAQSVTVRIDTVGPTTSAAAASGYRGRALTLSYKVADARSSKATGIRIVVKNGAGAAVKTFSPSTRATATWYAVKWTPAARGLYRYYVYAKDLAGNPQRVRGSAAITVR
jgi:uncharacterized protein YkwD